MRKQKILIGLVVALVIISFVPNVSASTWWDGSFSKRVPVCINNVDGTTQTYYQVPLNITYDTSMQADFDDIRFVNTSTAIEEPYWVLDKVDGSWCQVWFNATYIKGGEWSNTTTDMYYGNTTVSSLSNGGETFVQWHGAASAIFHDTNVMTIPLVYEGSVRRSATSSQVYFGVGDIQNIATGTSDSLACLVTEDATALAANARDDGVQSSDSIADTWTVGTYYRVKIVANASNYASYYLKDSTSPDLSLTSNIPDESMGLVYYAYSGTGAQEWSFIRKYAASEPSLVVGSEEQYSESPTITGNSTYNFGVNFTFVAGGGYLITNSFNISWSNNTDSGWENGTTNLFFDQITPPHGYLDVDIYSFNTTEGLLIENPDSDNVTVPNNAVTLTVTLVYSGLEGETISITDTSSTDADGDTPVYSFNMTGYFEDFSTITGFGSWVTEMGTAGIYYADLGVSDGYSSTDNKTLTITISSCNAPTISSILNTTVSYNTTKITWDTNFSTNNRIKYSENPDLSYSEWSEWDNGTTSVDIDLIGLEEAQKYYYQVWSWNISCSGYTFYPTGVPYLNFTSGEDTSIPCKPSNPSPANESTNVLYDLTISWSGDGDTYDVWFGEVGDVTKQESNQTGTSYYPGILEINTTYYWYVVAWNLNGQNESEMWHYTTAHYKLIDYSDLNMWDDWLGDKNETINISSMAGGIASVYTNIMHGMFYVYIFGLTFLVIWIRQEHVILPTMLAFVSAGMIWTIAPVEFQQYSYILFVLGVAGIIFSFFKGRTY